MKPKHGKCSSQSKCRHDNYQNHHHHHHHHRYHAIAKLESELTNQYNDYSGTSSDINVECTPAQWDVLTSNMTSTSYKDELIVEKDPCLQTVREKRELLVDRLRIYNNLLKFHKKVKEDQVYLYKKLQEMDELYLRNTGAILRLGFCPCLVHQQTSSVGDRLMKIHRKLRIWDKKMEEISEIAKEPSTKKTTTAVLQLLKICETSQVGRAALADFHDIALPDVVWDLGNKFIERINLPIQTSEWRNVRMDVRESLFKVELKFKEVCLEFGVRKGPAEVSSGNKAFNYAVVAADVEIDDEREVSHAEFDHSSCETPQKSSSFV